MFLTVLPENDGRWFESQLVTHCVTGEMNDVRGACTSRQLLVLRIVVLKQDGGRVFARDPVGFRRDMRQRPHACAGAGGGDDECRLWPADFVIPVCDRASEC